MDEPRTRQQYFTAAFARGVALGLALQIGILVLAGCAVLAWRKWNIDGDVAAKRIGAWTVMSACGLSSACTFVLALRLRRLHKMDKARGVALSIPLALGLGLMVALTLFLLLLVQCG